MPPQHIGKAKISREALSYLTWMNELDYVCNIGQ